MVLLKAKTMDLATANANSFQRYKCVYISYSIDRTRKCDLIPEGMAQFSWNFKQGFK